MWHWLDGLINKETPVIEKKNYMHSYLQKGFGRMIRLFFRHDLIINIYKGEDINENIPSRV